MILKKIYFDKTVQFEGRNGTFKCSGITLQEDDDRITIFPITSKDKIGRGMIEIPLESIEEVSSELSIFLDEIRNRHLFSINGYWIDDKSEFENYLVWEYHDLPAYIDEDEIFFYGLSEQAIKEAIKYQQPVNGEFIITSYTTGLPF